MDTLLGLCKDVNRPDGTIATNVGNVFVPGTPFLSPYAERFTLKAIEKHGLNLDGQIPQRSPYKTVHIKWTVERRVRPRNTIEHTLLLSERPNPNWGTCRIPAEGYRPEAPPHFLGTRSGHRSSVHPAGNPEEIPRPVIQMTTDDHPMDGSNTTEKVAFELRRHSIVSEAMESYVRLLMLGYE